MEYQSLYRKYRPKNFDEVVGQEVTQKILKNALESNKISHAYLFAGPRGTGKTSIAKIFAKTVNCEFPKNGNCCEKCTNCLIANSKDSVDIIEIDAASNNGVDEIRELRNKINLVPTSLKYKVYIIDEVHMLTTGAFNALLKTLEEPPKHVIFILATTEIQKVPTTILSRCQTLEFKKIDNESLIKKLTEISEKENIKIDNESLKEISKYAEGGLRDAIGILEKVSLFAEGEIRPDDIRKINSNISKNQAGELTKKILNNNIKEVLTDINDYHRNGIDLLKLVEELILNIRELVLLEESTRAKKYIGLIELLCETKTKMIISTTPKVILEVALIGFCINAGETEEINESKAKSEVKKENTQKEIEKQKIKTYVRENGVTENLKNIRVNNTLTAASKELIKKAREKWSDLQSQAFNVDYGAYARILYDDATPVAASNEYMIITFKVEGLARQCNESLNKIEDLVKNILNCDYKLICITESEWKEYIEEYKKNKEKFKYIEEKSDTIVEEEKKEKSSLKDKAKELFGEI